MVVELLKLSNPFPVYDLSPDCFPAVVVLKQGKVKMGAL
jgi:hypothetical protein